MVEIETIFSRTHYRCIQNVMKYIKVIPRNSCKGFPYRSRNFISSNDSFEDVSGMEVSRDDWKAGNGRTGQSFLCPASSANDLHPRSCMNQGGSYGDASLYEYLRASPAPISLRAKFLNENLSRNKRHRFEPQLRRGTTCYSYAWSSLIP